MEPGPDLLQAPRHPHRVGPVAEVALDLTGHVRDHERPELGSPRVEAVDRLDQPDAPDLHEVLVELSACAVSTGEALDERHVLLDQPLASSEVAVLVVLAQQDPRGFAGALASPWRAPARRLLGCRALRAPKGLRSHHSPRFFCGMPGADYSHGITHPQLERISSLMIADFEIVVPIRSSEESLVIRRSSRVAARRRSVCARSGWAVIGCCVVFGAVAASSAAASGPPNASRGPISWRYQAIQCDTAHRADLARAAATEPSALAAAHPGFPALRGRFPSRETGPAIARYQLRNVISESRWIVSPGIAVEPVDHRLEHASITSFASHRDRPARQAPSAPTDARRLLQLAVVLGAAYVLFLVAWFWGTREHRGRVGSAARS